MAATSLSAWEWLQSHNSNEPIDPTAEARFFTYLRVRNGTYKTTCSGRLDDFNRLILASLLVAPLETIRAMDVGASSGVTSLEWAEQFEASGVPFRLLATDLTAITNLHRYKPWFHALVDDQGRPLQYQICGRVFRGYPSRGDVLRLTIVPIWLAKCLHLLFENAGYGIKDSVPMVTSGLLRHPCIEVRTDDIFRDDADYHGRFDVVRAANILNRNYFGEDKLKAGIGNLARRLRRGGILAVCRTRPDGTNHGSLFRSTAGCLRKIEQLGDGSEVDDLCG
jgi:hypothetical protein